MTVEQVFRIWAPDEALWSPWVKPVVFTGMNVGLQPEGLVWARVDLELPPADGKTVVVIDVPGGAGVWLGMAAARQGYRPVPLYNAVPGARGQVAAVDMWEIVSALREAALELAELKLPAVAPPAFVLDANRRTGSRTPLPGQFDNRSISFVTDFPGPNLLRNVGVENALLVQEGDRLDPQPDLAHTLRRWQEIGMAIRASALGSGGDSVPVNVRRPAWYRSIWQRLAVGFGLRRNALGGFGGVLPEPSSGG